AQLVPDLAVAGPLLADEEAAQPVELAALAFRLELGPQPGHHLPQQGQRPAALEELLGREAPGRLGAVALLGVPGVEGQGGPAAAALLGAGAVALVGEEVVERGQQERAELALAPVHAGEEVLRQQAGEELL